MQWTPDMLRALGVGETGVQQVFSQTAPVPKSGPFPNYSPYTQAGSAIGTPPSAQAVVPRTPTIPTIRTTGGLPITDAQYKPVGPQRQIGYTPKFTQGSATGMPTSGPAYNPYGDKMYQGGKGFGKAPAMLGRVAKAGIGGAGGALAMDMLFPDTANDINDVAMIQQYKPLRSHGMTTPQAAGFPALQQMPNQAQFEAEFRKAQEMKKSDYGKVPVTGYFQVEGQPRRYYSGDAAKATGGFSRPSTADANLAFEDEQDRLVAERNRQDQLQREYNAELESQRNFDANVNWALSNPNAPGATAYLTQIQQGRKIGQTVTPLSERQAGWYKTKTEGEAKQAQGQAQLRQALGSPEEQALKQAQAQYYTAQAAGLPQANAIKAAQALQQARAKLAENDARTLDAVLKAGDPNAIMALGAYPQFRNFVAAYLAAQEASKE